MGCQCTDPRLYTNSVQPGVSTWRAPQALTSLNVTGAKSNAGTNALVLMPFCELASFPLFVSFSDHRLAIRIKRITGEFRN